MSLFNMLAGAAAQLLGGQQNSPLAGILQQLLSGTGQQAGAMPGQNPLEALLRQFQQAGLGDAMQSWIGTGPNQPVSGDALAQVFGRQRVDAMAQQAGTDSGSLMDQLAQILPQAVDGLTPQGRIPDGNTVQDMLAQLFRR